MRIIQNAQAAEEFLIAEERDLNARIEALDAVRGNYITKVGESYRALSGKDVEDLGAVVGLQFLVADHAGADFWSNFGEASQLRDAIAEAVAEGAFAMGNPDTLTTEGYITYESLLGASRIANQELRAALERMTTENYAEIAKRKRALEAQIALRVARRAWLGERVNDILALRDNAPDDATRAGFLSGEGYYVVRLSGAGWIKKSAGYATYSAGHQYFVIRADDDHTEPVKKYYWEFPAGYDVRNQFAVWIDDKEQKSRKACRDLPALGPVTRPHIWVEGPRYEVVYGPYLGQTPEQFGSHRINNAQPGSALQWTHESGRIADVKAACNALGAPF